MSIKTKLILALAFVAFSIWFYFTPHLAVSGMKSAAETKDATKLSGYVNFSALKESLKASFNAKLVSEVMKEKDDNPFRALGAAMAVALINPMIDALVTPESLAMMMKGDKPQFAQSAVQSRHADSDADTSMSYESFDRFIVTVKKKGTTEDPLGFVFLRDGIFSWKLSALRIPDDVKVTMPIAPASVVKPEAPKYSDLGTFTANLLPEKGVSDRYVQVSITVKVTMLEIEDKIKSSKPDISHRVNMLLQSKRASELTTTGGKEMLANEIKMQIEDALGDNGVSEVLFTSFAIQ